MAKTAGKIRPAQGQEKSKPKKHNVPMACRAPRSARNADINERKRIIGVLRDEYQPNELCVAYDLLDAIEMLLYTPVDALASVPDVVLGGCMGKEADHGFERT